MLKVKIRSESGQKVRRTNVSIANIGKGPVTDYAVTVGNGREADARLLVNYPRWSEPVLGLVARCLAMCREQIQTEQLTGPIQRLTCETSLLSFGVGRARALAELAVEHSKGLYCARSADANGNELRRTFISVATSPAALTVEAICRMLWHVPELPPMPTALELPIRRAEVPYVRLADIPAWVVPAFSKFIERRRRLVIPGESGQCALARDWLAFLGVRST